MHADKLAHHRGKRTRVIHNVAAVQEVGLAELLAGEIGGHGNYLRSGRERRLDPRRGVLDSQTLLRPDTQLASGQEVDLWIGLAVLDVVAGYHHVELVRKPQNIQNASGLLAVGLGGQGGRVTLAPDVTQQGDVVWVSVVQDELGIGHQRLVDTQPYLNVGLPRRVHPELHHAGACRTLQPEAAHQSDGDLLSREANQILEGFRHLSFVQVGAKFGSRAGAGESLELLRFDQGAVEVKDERADHAVSPARRRASKRQVHSASAVRKRRSLSRVSSSARSPVSASNFWREKGMSI